MSLQKRFSVILCTFGFFLCFISFSYFSVFASTSLQTEKFVVRKSGSSSVSLDSKLVKDYINLCSENFDSVEELQCVALSWVFYTIYNDGYSVLNSDTLELPYNYDHIDVVFSSSISEQFSGSQFDDSFLKVYFDIFTGKYDKSAISDDNTSNCSHLKDSTLQDYISLYYSINGKSVPAFENYSFLWWKPTLVSAWNIGTPITCIAGVQRDFSKYYITYEQFKQVFNGFLYLYNSDNGNLSSKININTVSGSDFKNMIESENTSNSPKGKGLWKSSYRTDKYVHSNKDTTLLTLWNSSEIGDRFCDEIYLYPFYTDYHGITYYSKYQFRVYYDMFINGDITDYALYVETYMYTDGVGYVIQPDYSVRALNGTSMTKPYTIVLGKPFWKVGNYPYLDFGFYLTDNDYYSLSLYNPGHTSFGGGLVQLPVDAWNFTSADGLDITLPFTEGFFRNKYSDFFYIDDDGKQITAPERTDIDIGYICSSEMISRTYTDVDTTKIPDNYYVTISGDTIYDYSITNPETGQSDTINYYITNNYTLPENGGSGGSGSGGSGGTGGNVTVGGKIDVDGTVSVDVNVNVNGGAGGTNFGDVNTDPLDDYLNSALDESSGFRAFLGDFFSFLPFELLVLLGIGLTFVIVGRIMGR